MDKLLEEKGQEGEWGKDHKQVREGFEKPQAMTAPPVGVGQVLWEWPEMCYHKCCTNFFSSQ